MHSTQPTLVVTGAGGLLGYALCLLARRHWSVVGLYRQRRPRAPGITCIQAELTDLKALTELLRGIAPAAIIHAAAAAQVGVCQAHPAWTEAINVAVPAYMAQHCAAAGIPLLFTSTDLVFDGRHPPYAESSPPQPICVYGDQKTRAENEVLARYPGALVCRLPLLFGWAPDVAENFALQMLSALARRQPLALFTNEYRTPVDHWSAARGLLMFLGNRHGLLHLGGRTRVSRYGLGLMMAKGLGAGSDKIRPTRVAEIELPYERPPDCSLDSRAAYRAGYTPAPLATALRRMVASWRRSGS